MMEQTTQSSGTSAEQQAWLGSAATPPKPEAQKRRPLDRTRKGVRFVLAVDAWKRTGAVLRHRASFPLLRRVLVNERRSIVSSEDLKVYPSEVLRKSCLNHLIVIWLMWPVLLWAMIGFIRGIAYYVRFDTLTPWVGYSLPLAVYAAGRIFISNRSRKAQLHELEARK